MTELTLLVNGDVLAGMSTNALKSFRFNVGYDEADREGIVFFGNYFRLAHRALESYLPSIGIPWPEWFTNSEWGVPLRHVEADYLESLRPGQEFTVSISIEKLGDSSCTFIYQFQDTESQLSATLKTTHVFVARSTRKKISLPLSVRQRLSAARST